ncbi:MAG: hypothetical protein KC466_09725 [Myxococcales bacterium]|nr:hypothetical protein [Myxococcales bacterium]
MSRIQSRLVGIAIGALALQSAPVWAHHTGAGGAGAGGGLGAGDAGVFARDVEPPASWLEYSFEYADLDRDIGELITHQLQGSYAFRVGTERRNFALRASWPIFHLLSDVERDAWGTGDLTAGLWWNALNGAVGDDEGSDRRLQYSVNLGLTTLFPIGDRDRDFGAKHFGNGATLAASLRYGPVGWIASSGLDWEYDGRERPGVSWSTGPAAFLWNDRISILGTFSGLHLTDGDADTFRAGGRRIFFAPAMEIAPFTSGRLAGLSIGVAGRWAIQDTTRLRSDRVIPLTEPDLRSDVEASGIVTIRYAF